MLITYKHTMSSTIKINNEFDLHTKVVAFVRKRYPDVIIIPGLGELQTTDDTRIKAWQKGYTAGQPGLILINTTGQDAGLAIEMKTPKTNNKGTTEKQKLFLTRLKEAAFKVVVSNSYDDILFEIVTYMGKQ